MLRIIGFLALLFLMVVLFVILEWIETDENDAKNEAVVVPKRIPENYLFHLSDAFGGAYAATQNNYRFLNTNKQKPTYSGLHFSSGFSNDFS